VKKIINDLLMAEKETVSSMTCYIISYDASDEDSKKNIIKIITSYSPHAQICNNTWAVVTSEEATSIRDRLNQIIKPSDRFFVIKSGEEAGWAQVICEKSWLHKYLMNEF
jgi:hypothetical protein